MFRMELSLAEPNAFWNKNAVFCHTTVVGVNHLGFNTKHEVESKLLAENEELRAALAQVKPLKEEQPRVTRREAKEGKENTL